MIELDYMEMEMKGKIIDDKMRFRVGPGVMELAFVMGYRSSGGGATFYFYIYNIYIFILPKDITR